MDVLVQAYAIYVPWTFRAAHKLLCGPDTDVHIVQMWTFMWFRCRRSCGPDVEFDVAQMLRSMWPRFGRQCGLDVDVHVAKTWRPCGPGVDVYVWRPTDESKIQ